MSNQSHSRIAFDRTTERVNIYDTKSNKLEHRSVRSKLFGALYELPGVIGDLDGGKARGRSNSGACNHGRGVPVRTQHYVIDATEE